MWKRNITMWLQFTVILGILPLLFLIIISLINECQISLISAMKEIFFLTIILNADTLKTFSELKDRKVDDWKVSIFRASIVILIISSVLYGIMLASDNENNIMCIYIFSVLLCGLSGVMGVLTQIFVKRNSNVKL